MAGHSHWANIAAKKGVADKKRGKLFGKLSRAIIVAAQHGGGDPTMNLALRYAIDKARKASMPKDNIERAVKKGAGGSDGQSLVEITYEGYGPGGVALLVECLTDSTNRVFSEIRKIFDQAGGRLGKTGAVQWKFKTYGLLAVKKDAVEEDALLEMALEAGADDVTDQGDVFEILTPPERYYDVCRTLDERSVPTEVRELTKIAEVEIDVDIGTAQKILRFMERLDDHDDVQNVYADFTPPQEALAQL